MIQKSFQKILFVLLVMMILGACKKDFKDFYPSVSPEFYLPIAKGKITIKDRITQQITDTNLVEDPITKLYKFVIRQEIPTPSDITNQIPSINVAQSNYSYTFNPPKVANINASTNFSFGDLTNGTALQGASGNNVPIPAITLTPDTNDVTIDNIKIVVLESGLLNISITNSMPFDVNSMLTIKDSLGTTIYSQLFALTRVGTQNATQTDQEDISGKTLTNPLKATINNSIPAGQPNGDFSTGGGGIATDFALSNLVARSGTAKIDVDNPDNKVDKTERIVVGGLDKGILFDQLKLKSGTLNYSINNISGISPDLQFEVVFQGMLDANGNAFKLGKTSTNPGLSNFIINFNNDSTTASIPANVDTNAIPLNIVAKFVADAQGFVDFNVGSGVQIDVTTSIDSGKFLRASGYLGSNTFTNTDTIDAISDLALLQSISPGAIEFDGVELNLNFNNSLGFDVAIDSKIDAISQYGAAYNISSTFNNVLEKGTENATETAAVPVERVVQLDKAKFTELINAIPSQLYTDFKIITNKGVSPSPGAGNVLYDNSTVSGNLEVSAPLSLFLNNLVFKDTMVNSLPVEPIDLIEDVQGKLTLIVDNYFPLTLKLTVTTTDSLYNPIDTLLTDASVITGATPDADGRVSTPVINRFNIPITYDNYIKLENAKFFMVTADAKTEDASGTKTPLKLFSDAFVEYKMIADISVKINKNE